jgi:hypothetical protein
LGDLVTRRRAADVLRDESGNTVTSVVIAVAALVFGIFLVGIATSLFSSVSATNDRVAMSAAVDQRLGAYADALDAATTAPLTAVCYPTLSTCVTVANVLDTATQRTVTLDAVFSGGVDSMTATRTLTVQTGSHISGFDALGNPVWVTAPGVAGAVYRVPTMMAGCECRFHRYQTVMLSIIHAVSTVTKL